LTSQNLYNNISNPEGMSMRGGYYLPKGRKTYRVWFPWGGHKFFFSKYLDGTALYHPKQCERLLSRIQSEVDEGIFNPADWGKDKPLLLEKAWETYNERKPCGKARMEARENIFKRFIQPFFKGQPIKLRQVEIDNWFTEIQKQGYTPSYLRVIVVTFKAFLNSFSYDLGRVPPFPSVSIPSKIFKWLSEDEQAKVHEFIPGHHLPIFHFLAITGCRPSEACNLKKADIDWRKGVFAFRDTKTRQDNPLPITPAIEKCLVGASRAPTAKPVGLDTTWNEALRSERPDQWGERPGPPLISNIHYIFCTVQGRKYRRQTLYGIWTRANLKAHEKYGIPMVSNYRGNRHSKACNNMGELALISRLLGHSSIKTTERYYARYETEAISKVMGGKGK
jgi:integrase